MGHSPLTGLQATPDGQVQWCLQPGPKKPGSHSDWQCSPWKPGLQEQLPSLGLQDRVCDCSQRQSSEQPGPKAQGGQARWQKRP